MRNLSTPPRDERKILVYEAAGPSLLQANEAKLGVFLRALSHSPGCESSEFRVYSGICMHFVNRTALYATHGRSRSMPKTPEEAFATARTFLGEFNRLAQESQDLRWSFFPNGIRSLSAQLALNPETRVPDHWYVRLKVFLPPTKGRGEKALPVFDSRLDLRVGYGNAILEFFTNWRPLRSCREVDCYAVLPPQYASGQLANQRPQMVYLMPTNDSDYIAPYFLEASKSVFIPATDYSEELKAVVESEDHGDADGEVTSSYGSLRSL